MKFLFLALAVSLTTYSASSSALMCYTDVQLSKDATFPLQGLSSSDVAAGISSSLLSGCAGFSVLSSFADQVEFQTIEMSERASLAGVPSGGDTNSVLCHFKIQFRKANESRLREVSCRVESLCPQSLLGLQADWKNEHRSGGESCN